MQKQAQALSQKNTERKKSITGCEDSLNERRKAHAETKPTDTAEITAQIKGAEAVNEKIRQNAERAKIEASREAASNAYSAKGAELKKAESDRATLLREASFPLPGLSVNGTCVTFNDVPISELSTAERLRVGASIAVAQNPKAKIVLADDVSLLDRGNLAILHEMCAGCQLWQVVNDDSGDVGFYIEAGEIKTENDKEKVA